MWHVRCGVPRQESSRHSEEESIIASKSTLRDRLSTFFELVEDVIYVSLGFLLAGIAIALLISEFTYFAEFIVGGSLSKNIVLLLDRILLIIIFAEVLYTVQVSFQQRVLQPAPFLVVSLIAVTRRILVLTAELPNLMKESEPLFQHAMIELALLTVLIFVLVISLSYLKPANPNAAAAESTNKKTDSSAAPS